MKSQKRMAFLLSMLLLLSVGVGPAFAEKETEITETAEAQENTETAEIQAEEGKWTAPKELRLENLEREMRGGNDTIRALEENIAIIEEMDYDEMYEDIRTSLNQLSTAQWWSSRLGDTYNSAMAEQSYNALRETFEDIKSGKLQKNNADLVRQLRNTQNQLFMAAESLYFTLLEMDLSEDNLEQSLATMDRNLEEMTLRRDLGQVSDLTVSQLVSGRASLVSGQRTLEMNRSNVELQLAAMTGRDLNQKLYLAELLPLSESALENMALGEDLEKAKAASYALYDAKKTLEEAQETYEKDSNAYFDKSLPGFLTVQRTWNAAQYTYNSTVQNFELGFRTLYANIKDYEQVLKAAQATLASKQESYDIAKTSYELGNISRNKLAETEDEVASAQREVEIAALHIHSAYRSYRWAVDHGIIN